MVVKLEVVNGDYYRYLVSLFDPHSIFLVSSCTLEQIEAQFVEVAYYPVTLPNLCIGSFIFYYYYF